MLIYIVTCRVVHATKMTGSSSDDLSLRLHTLSQSHLRTGNTVLSLIYTRCNSLLHISPLHKLQFLCRVFTVRLLVTNLSKEDYSALVARW
jgi:hypothetical protein